MSAALIIHILCNVVILVIRALTVKICSVSVKMNKWVFGVVIMY